MDFRGWLHRITQPPAAKTGRKLPVRSSQVSKTGVPGLPVVPARPATRRPVQQEKALPNATVIYGIGASLMFGASFLLLIHRRFLPALVVFILGACLLGFALHLLKHQD
jgi:hypothetical protein